jgi:hypothetical protein
VTSPAGRTFSAYRPNKRWILGNGAFLVILCALSGPGMATGDEHGVSGIVAAVCFLAPFRAVSALIELYLARHWRHRAIVIGHTFGLGIGAMIGTTPAEKLYPDGGESTSGLALGGFTYVMTTLIFLIAAWLVVVIRAHGRDPEPLHTPRPVWSLSSLSALFWFNTVFILVVGLLITPSMNAQEHSGLPNAFLLALLVGVLLRIPGAWAEWRLTKHAHHRAIHAIHIAAGLLTALIIALNIFSPTAGTSTTASIRSAAQSACT